MEKCILTLILNRHWKHTNSVALTDFTLYRELSSTFARLCQLVDEATNHMDVEIKTLEKEIRQLEEAANSAKVLRNKANYITKQLEMFDDAYLKLRDKAGAYDRK